MARIIAALFRTYDEASEAVRQLESAGLLTATSASRIRTAFPGPRSNTTTILAATGPDSWKIRFADAEQANGHVDRLAFGNLLLPVKWKHREASV